MDASRGMTRRSVRMCLGAVARRWHWPVVFSILIAFAAVLLYMWRVYTPEYKISTTFIPAMYTLDQDGNAIITDSLGSVITRSNAYTQLVKNEQVRDAVRNAVDFQITKEEYDGAVSTAFNEYSAAVSISVNWNNEAQAYQLLDTVKAYLTYTVSHSADAGTILWLDGYSSEFELKATRPSIIFAAGALIGLCVGACFSLFLGMIDKRVYDLEQVRYGGAVDVIGVIGKDRVFSGKSYANRNDLNNSHKQLTAIALYLRSQMEAHGKKLIMCVAPTNQCGTSRVAKEVAHILANIRMKVLILKLSMKESPASDQPDKEPEIKPLFPGVDGCDCVWDDPENNSDFMGPLSKVLSSAMESYKFILIDCPPLLDNIEMAMFAAGMDATLLVFRYGKTEYEDVLSAVSLLERADAKPLWCVWNHVDKRYLRKPYVPQ